MKSLPGLASGWQVSGQSDIVAGNTRKGLLPTFQPDHRFFLSLIPYIGILYRYFSFLLFYLVQKTVESEAIAVSPPAKAVQAASAVCGNKLTSCNALRALG